MELNDLNKISRSKSLNKLLDTRFGFQLDMSKLTEGRASAMISTAEKQMLEIKESVSAYQTDKKYLCSKLVKECVEAWLVENNLNIVEKDEETDVPPNDGKIEPQQRDPKFDSQRNTALRAIVGSNNFARAKRALELYKDGKTVPPNMMDAFLPVIDMIDEILASGMANVRLLQMLDTRAKKKLGITESVLTEGEMESAELVLAAKDMVDRIQGMLEDVGEMMNEQLPPLVDSIRDEMGNDKATSFENAARSTLETFLDATTSARADMDNASRVLTGTAEAEVPSVDLSADDSDVDMDIDSEIDMDIDASEAGQEGDNEMDRAERI
jgi:hypothetical protein